MSNDWINLGKIVENKLRDGEKKPSKALQTGYNVEVTVKQTKADGSVVTRIFPPKSYFNITEEKAYLEKINKNNPGKLEKALENLKKFNHVKYDVTASPAKDTSKVKYSDDLDDLDLN